MNVTMVPVAASLDMVTDMSLPDDVTFMTGIGVADRIEAIHLMNATKVRVGGAVTFIPTPLVLLQGGTVYRNVSEPPEFVDIDAIRLATPYKVGEWRNLEDVYEVRWNEVDSWRRITWQEQSATPLGDDWVGNGVYTASASASHGSAGDGGGSYHYSTSFEFSPDGRFAKGGTLEMASVGGGGSYTGSLSRQVRTGTYSVQGYGMTLSFDDGEVRRHAAITTDGDAVWLDNIGYIRLA